MYPFHALSIVRYPGHAISTWLGDSSMLSGLQQLSLYSWDGYLPALGNLPELRRLQIVGMPKVRRVGAKWFGSNHGFPKLEYLQFIKMAEWEGWHLEEKSFLAFLSLRKFFIYRCPELRSLPSIFSTSLREIYVNECSNLSNWFENLPGSIVTLKSISAEWVNEMPSFPNLECLGIHRDGGASELSHHLVKLGALKTPEIQNCPNLESLPWEMASLEQLQKLEIYDCHKLKRAAKRKVGNGTRFDTSQTLQLTVKMFDGMPEYISFVQDGLQPKHPSVFSIYIHIWLTKIKIDKLHPTISWSRVSVVIHFICYFWVVVVGGGGEREVEEEEKGRQVLPSLHQRRRGRREGCYGVSSKPSKRSFPDLDITFYAGDEASPESLTTRTLNRFGVKLLSLPKRIY